MDHFYEERVFQQLSGSYHLESGRQMDHFYEERVFQQLRRAN
jgi:hypothetical protein